MRNITKRSYRFWSMVVLLTLLVAAKTSAQPFGQWDFNAGNLTATVGSDMQYTDGTGGPTQLATQFGTTTGLGIPNINGTPANVMKFPAATGTMGYLMPNPSQNGGGSLVNEYTIIFDLLYPTNGVLRPLVDTDSTLFVPGADLVVSASDGIGITPNGPYDGTLAANTWYRVGFSITANEVHKYINGVEVGSQGGTGLDGRLGLAASSVTLILANSVGNAAPGYVNSIQLRDVALNAGQMEAIGGPSAAGIPQTIPPVPSFIQSRIPTVNATGVSPFPTFNVVLNQGDTTVTGGSIQLKLDGALLAATVTPTPPTFTVNYTVPPAGRLDPNSSHTLTLTWTDSVVGSKTNSWSFVVQNYQVVTLPAPFYLEDFNELSENPNGDTQVPSGWSVSNRSGSCTPGYNLNDLTSDSFTNWCLITSNRFYTVFSGLGPDRTNMPPIVKNGVLLTSLTSGNLMYAESDQRDCSTPGVGFGEFQEMYTADISCVGRSNVFVAWNSIYEQNQDNLDCIEYSVDRGTNWLPVIYYLQGNDDGQGVSDIIRFPNGDIDVFTTFSRIEENRNWNPVAATATNYGIYIKAPISTNLIPYIQARTNDDQVDGKRIEVVRLPAADGKATVRFRFLNSGTGSWFWGIDDFGLYEITTPIITSQPQNKTINATESATFSVVATSPTPLSYQWQHAGTNLSNGGHFSGVNTANLLVSNASTNDSGSYKCILSNSGGSTPSSSATLTVVDAPLITSQPVSVLVSKGFPASLSVTAAGRPALHYQWKHGGVPVSGATGATLAFLSAQLSDAGQYQVVVTNVTGSVTSSVANLVVFDGPVNSNLVVHLKFDNNYLDSSGRANNATPVGTPGFTSPGKIGSHAFVYTTFRDGSSFNYATLGYPDDLKFTTATDFSVSFWMKMAPNSWVDDPPFVANKNWDSGGNIGWDISLAGSGGNFKFNYREECPHDRQDFNSPTVVTDGQWHHILVSFQRGAVARTFLDGTLQDTRSILIAAGPPATTIDTDPAIADNQDCPGNGTRNANAVNVGQDGRGAYTDGGSMGVTNAVIDDVGIWRRAVTPQEATAIYQAGQAGLDLQQAVVASLGQLQVQLVGANVQFTWVGGTGIRLQRTTALNPSTWADVAGTLGNSTYSEPRASFVKAYYRLYKP